MEFTPVSATVGGALIGLAAALLLLSQGRIAGISGIFGGALHGAAGDRAWRVAFLLGLPLGAAGVGVVRGGITGEVATGPLTLVVAGLLVGIGTQLGNGCTSGHGVCGISRGSKRSIVATLVFMAAGMATVYLTRHVAGGAP